MCGCKGIADFVEDAGLCDTSGQNQAAQVLPDLQGKRPCGKEAFLLTSLFGYFCGYKSNWALPRPRAGLNIN
jgi:hypothetical protein